MFPKTQDETIDRLLRAQGGGAGKELPLCREFDADLANAYVERRLQAGERAGYENHLAACSPCRKAIVALTRMAQAEQVPAAVAAVEKARGASPIRQWLGALTVPQWAMAAAAVVALAVALPLVLSHRSTPDTSSAVAQDSGPPASDLTARAMTAPTAAGEAPNLSSARDASAPARGVTAEKAVASERNEAPAQPAGAADGVSGGAATALAQTPEPKPADQAAAKTEAATQPSPAPATEPAKPQAGDVAKDQDKKESEAKDAKASPSEKRADSAVADSIAPPPPPPSRVPEADRARRDEGPASGVPGMQPFTNVTAAAEATTSASRRVGNHVFSFRGGVWVDKEYKPDKDMHITPVVRDSEVYRSLLAKDAKIEPFLKGFPQNARVIFKFKGVVYKLVPQDSDQ